MYRGNRSACQRGADAIDGEGTDVQEPPTRRFHPADLIRVTGVPPSVAALPRDVADLFAAVVGRVLRVDDVDARSGCLALNVHADGSQADDWCEHTLWLDPSCAVSVVRARRDA